MSDKLSSNFCSFLQKTVLDCNNNEKREIIELLTIELGGILKQIGMLVKIHNASIEFDNVKDKFSNLISNVNSSIDNLLTKQYNINYQYLFANIIRTGSYSLQSNRYDASCEKIKLLETISSDYEKCKSKYENEISESLKKDSSVFIKNVIESGIYDILDDEFLDLPSKQNEIAYTEIKKLLTRTIPIIDAKLNDICVGDTQKLQSQVSSHLNSKIKLEKGFTDTNIDNLSLSQLLEARKVFLDKSIKNKEVMN